MQPSPKLPQKLKRKQPLSVTQIQLMLSSLLRDSVAFTQIHQTISATHFPEDLRHLAGIWAMAKAHYDAFGKLPDEATAWAEGGQIVNADNFDERHIEDIEKVLTDAYSEPIEVVEKRRRSVLAYAKQFLEESAQRQLRDTVGQTVVNRIELPALLKTLEKNIQVITSMETGKVDLPFPDDLKQVETLIKVSTGCDWFDHYLRGGQAPGEVYGFAAPYGVGKTTMGIQLSCNRCMHELAQTKTTGRDKTPVVYTVFYEEEMNSVRHRMLSYAGNVPKEMIEDGRWSEMSTRAEGNYKPYELSIYAEALRSGIKPPGEMERLVVAKEQLTVNWRPIDFTGSKPEYNQAAGQFVDGIVSVIEQDQSLSGNPGVSMIVIDYASAAADRHIQHEGLDPTRFMRPLLGRMPLRIKNQLAVRFGCPVWVMQQLNTDANSRAAGVAPKITDLPEARNFAENLSFAFLMGTKTADSLVVLSNVKQRRAEKQPDTVLFIDGAYSRIKSTNNKYRIDNARIVSAAEFDQFAEAMDYGNVDFEEKASKAFKNGLSRPDRSF